MNVRTKIIIDASPKKVWKILTDFPRYCEWNPFVRSVSGKLRKGARLRVLIRPEGGREMRFNPTVTKVVHDKEFRWIGHLMVPGILDGEHFFALERKGRGTLFRHSERFSGLLAGMGGLNKLTHRGLTDMNRALKQRAESR